VRRDLSPPERPTVTLALVNGRNERSEYVFDERSTCLIGRGEDCSPRLPNDEDHRSVSRHHCMLDINPPDVRIRDFGSRNGTFVNGVKIGQRDPGQSAAQGRELRLQERDLHDGDEVRLGRSVSIRIRVEVPRPTPTVFVRTGAGTTLPPPGCVKCGREISHEVGAWQGGSEYVCSSCRANPEQVMTLLVSLAQAGDRSDLKAIAEYTLLQELGRGGMGAVYLARHRGTGRLAALKLMLPKVAANSTARARFQREVELTRMLRHPNIATLYEDGFADGAFFFTTEYCEGGSLDRLLLQRGGKLPPDEAVRYAIDVLDGLEYAHSRGVVHRDLSPSNILLSDASGGAVSGFGAYVAKVGDFGLAKAFDQAGLSGLTRTGSTAGKPWYLARQQVVNFKDVPYAVDVWALAASLYKCLTGAYARDFPGDVDQWHVILYSDAVPIRRRDPSLPAALAEVVDTALREQPTIGFPTAAAFRDALRQAWPVV
jgi:pSer/pThr/pTyr-binding forkhead associated (FHA) protein